MSQLKDIAEEEHKMEMTPMIDVTFLLLIFFMCTIKFKTLEGKLSAYLPKDVGTNTTEAEPKEKVEIILTVLNEGRRLSADGKGLWSGETGVRFIYDSTRRIQFSVGPKRTENVDDLKPWLTRLHDADPERGCTIDARKGVAYQDVVQVLDRAIQSDFTDITFVGSFEK
jgi:biopolymer transport protein ExbD